MSLFSLAPSVVPGAMSVIGWYISVFALMLGLVSLKSGGDFYLKVATCIYALGILLFNEASRLFLPGPETTLVHIASQYLVLITFIAIIIYKQKNNKKPDKL